MENKKIRYIVKLQEDFCMPKTTIKHSFCGSIIHTTSASIIFQLNGCGGHVIIPINKIEWMAPSKELFEKGYNFENI